MTTREYCENSSGGHCWIDFKVARGFSSCKRSRTHSALYSSHLHSFVHTFFPASSLRRKKHSFHSLSWTTASSYTWLVESVIYAKSCIHAGKYHIFGDLEREFRTKRQNVPRSSDSRSWQRVRSISWCAVGFRHPTHGFGGHIYISASLYKSTDHSPLGLILKSWTVANKKNVWFPFSSNFHERRPIYRGKWMSEEDWSPAFYWLLLFFALVFDRLPFHVEFYSNALSDDFKRNKSHHPGHPRFNLLLFHLIHHSISLPFLNSIFRIEQLWAFHSFCQGAKSLQPCRSVFPKIMYTTRMESVVSTERSPAVLLQAISIQSERRRAGLPRRLFPREISAWTLFKRQRKISWTRKITLSLESWRRRICLQNPRASPLSQPNLELQRKQGQSTIFSEHAGTTMESDTSPFRDFTRVVWWLMMTTTTSCVWEMC